MKLHELGRGSGLRKARKRVGRGIGSGTGKTCGRGHKGAKSRSGGGNAAFEGGQMPLYRRVPKRGFSSLRKQDFAIVSLQRLQQAFVAEKLDPSKTLDWKELKSAGIIRRPKGGVRILADGAAELSYKMHLVVSGVSKAARAAIERVGGEVRIEPSSTLSRKPAGHPTEPAG